MNKRTLKTICAGGVLSVTALLGMTGCSANFGDVPATAHAGAHITGNVHGGQQAVIGAQVYLYAVGTGGIGTGSISILNAPGYVVTGPGGSFDITNDYKCPANSQVYLLALGGNPGLAGTVNNSYLSLMTALGSCSALADTQFVTINEVTTTAAVYALGQFMTSPTSIASSGSPAGILGMTHAFATANNLANTATGVANTKTAAGNGVVDQARINTLADAIAPCVNSPGTANSTDPCPTLSMTATGSATAITDTASALLYTTKNPYFNPSGLFGLANATAPFMPTLSAAPDAFVMPITYTGAGLDATPGSLAINTNGEIWIVAQDSEVIAALQNDGTPIAGSPFTGANNNPGNVAFDKSGNLEVTDFGSNTLSSFTASGTQRPSITGGGLNGPGGIAVDSNGNVWVTNQNNTISEFNQGFTALSGTNGYSGNPSYSGLFYIATDLTGHAFFTQTNSVLELDGTGKDLSNGGFPVCPGVASQPLGNGFPSTPANGISIDGSNQPWIQCWDGHNAGGDPTATATEYVTKLTTAGAGTTYPITASSQIINFIDAANNVWIIEPDRSRLQEMNSAGTVLTANIQTSSSNPTKYGIADAGYYKPQALQADTSGNLWISNVYAAGTVTPPTPLIEYVGLASPTQTPLYFGAVTP